MKIPKTWSSIPLKNFVHYMEYNDEKPEDLLDRIELIKKKYCAILGCDWDEVNQLSGKEQEQISIMMRTPLPQRLLLGFKHKGKRYRFYVTSKERGNKHAIIDEVKKIFEKLDIDTTKFTGGKYSAFKKVQSLGTMKYLHHLLFLSCERRTFGFKSKFPFIGWKKKVLTAQEIEQGIEDFKTLPMEVAYPMSIFFLKVSEELRGASLDYLNNQIQNSLEELQQIQMDLENDMDG